MADHTDESKPKVEGEAINIVVKDQSGNEVHFKIKTSTKLEKARAAGITITLILEIVSVTMLPASAAPFFWKQPLLIAPLVPSDAGG
jgi:hypothetical protein